MKKQHGLSLLVGLSLLAACTGGKKLSKNSVSACTNWAMVDNELRVPSNCQYSPSVLRLQLSHQVLQDGRRPDAVAPPYLHKYTRPVSIDTKVMLDGQPFTGILQFYHSKTDSMMADWKVVGGKLMKMWVRDSLGNVYRETWFAPPTPPKPPKPDPSPDRPDFPPSVRKPILYLYPETAQQVKVEVHLADGALTHTYPKYPEGRGWEVKAMPDGRLLDAKTEKEFYALYWEASDKMPYRVDEGFVVKGSETAEVLDSLLRVQGLSPREANEFIIYWLPHLENNPYNLLYFVPQDVYQQHSDLRITPQPQTLIRVMMLYRPLKQPLAFPQQNLKRVQRRGFTAVEWGGMEYLLMGTR